MGASCGGPDGSDPLRTAILAMEEVRSYHLSGSVTTRTGQGELRVLIESDVERPDRVRTIATIGGTVIESISVEGDVWVKDPETEAWKSELDPRTPGEAPDPFALLRSLTEVLLAGQEPIGGVTVDRIEARAPAEAVLRAFPEGSPAPQGGTAVVTVWIRRADSLVVRIVAVTEGPAPFTIDVAFSRFGERFGIGAPS